MQNYYTSQVHEVFDRLGIKLHLSRKKFMVSFILAMIQARDVLFKEIAVYLNDEAKVASNEVRIQNFFRDHALNYEQIALLLSLFLPPKGKVTLSIDRTEWDFGVQQTNILMVIASCKGIDVPIYWSMLDNKSGNSNTQDRIDLVCCCIKLLGEERIGLLLADREFIGHKWLKYLKDKGIRFCVRIPKSHHLHSFELDEYAYPTGALSVQKAQTYLSQTQAKGRAYLYKRDVMVDKVWGNAYIGTDAKGELLYLFGTAKAHLLAQLYKKRWRIEAFFQQIKKRGFDLENTHLKCNQKLKKLVAFVSIAYAIVTSVGRYEHLKVKAIPTKKHGYKANSFTRKGIDLFRERFRKQWRENIDDFNAIVQRFLHWIDAYFSPALLPD